MQPHCTVLMTKQEVSQRMYDNNEAISLKRTKSKRSFFFAMEHLQSSIQRHNKIVHFKSHKTRFWHLATMISLNKRWTEFALGNDGMFL